MSTHARQTKISALQLAYQTELVKLKAGNIVFETTILGVNAFGQLETEDSLPRTFNVGDVEWV